MSSTHTPGPWTITENRCSIVGADGGTLVVETTRAKWENLAAAAAQGNTLAAEHLPEVEANARLIAAAPDLLAACKDLLENLSDAEDTTDGDGEEYADITAARAAVAKATGVAHV